MAPLSGSGQHGAFLPCERVQRVPGGASNAVEEGKRAMRVRPTIVVLAAGQGSRFPGPRHKLEQPLGSGSVLGTTLANAILTRLPVVVVTTQALAPLVADQIALRDTVVVSDADARRGMGHSIAAGVVERASSPGWLMLPGDMPLVRPATMLAVAAL